MTPILAIDPGTEQSAWLLLEGDSQRPLLFAIEPNGLLLERLRRDRHVVVVIEKVESYGMAVGKEVFQTVHWAGRFTEACERQGATVHQLPRRAVKVHLCGSPRANDANIRQALVDLYGGTSVAKGLKSRPGPLHGISKDVWAALALAVTYADGVR